MEFKDFLNVETVNEGKKDLSKFADTLAKLTDKNDHMTARLLCAELCGDKRLLEITKCINNIIDYENNNVISEYTYVIYKRVHEAGRKKYGTEEWNKNIYSNT